MVSFTGSQNAGVTLPDAVNEAASPVMNTMRQERLVPL
jgi:hypothetical protein